MKVKSGDVVRLVSGGPPVTVERVEECLIGGLPSTAIHVLWFAGSTLHRDAVPVSAIVVEVQP